MSYTSDQCVSLIDKVTCTNESSPGVTATVTVQLLSPDGAAVQSFSKAIAAGATWPASDAVGHTLAVGGKINVLCPTASAIKVRISGRKVT